MGAFTLSDVGDIDGVTTLAASRWRTLLPTPASDQPTRAGWART